MRPRDCWLVWIMVLLCGQLFAVGERLHFDSRIYDLGKLRADARPMTATFVFTNVTSDTLTIRDIRTSCGCAVPAWSRLPIPPGGKGYFAITYIPEGHPGKFHKTIQIYPDATEQPELAQLVGEILPGAQEYRYRIGPLWVKGMNLDVGDLEPGTATASLFPVRNPSDSILTITVESDNPQLTVAVNPANLMPMMAGTLELQMATRSDDTPGEYSAALRLIVSAAGKILEEGRIDAYYRIVAPGDRSRRNGPCCVVATPVLDLGTIAPGEEPVARFRIVNTGNGNLVLSDLLPPAEFSLESAEAIIPPGKSGEIVLKWARNGGIQGYSQVFSLRTNDPAHPEVILQVLATSR